MADIPSTFILTDINLGRNVLPNDSAATGSPYAMTQTLDTPVLVAGGGPTGLVLASVLSGYGINCVLVERNAAHDPVSKDGHHQRGQYGAVAGGWVSTPSCGRVGVAPHHSFDVIFAPGLDGPGGRPLVLALGRRGVGDAAGLARRGPSG